MKNLLTTLWGVFGTIFMVLSFICIPFQSQSKEVCILIWWGEVTWVYVYEYEEGDVTAAWTEDNNAYIETISGEVIHISDQVSPRNGETIRLQPMKNGNIAEIPLQKVGTTDKIVL